jgi:hypothetical protein
VTSVSRLLSTLSHRDIKGEALAWLGLEEPIYDLATASGRISFGNCNVALRRAVLQGLVRTKQAFLRSCRLLDERRRHGMAESFRSIFWRQQFGVDEFTAADLR